LGSRRKRFFFWEVGGREKEERGKEERGGMMCEKKGVEQK
jgi:hypothetical protein